MSMFGIVNETFTASGAAKLAQPRETPSCRVASGKQAIHPPIRLIAKVPQGISPNMPWNAPVIRKAPSISNWQNANKPATIVSLAKYTDARDTGMAKSCFQPPPLCS